MNLLETQFMDKVKPHDLFDLKLRFNKLWYRILFKIKGQTAWLLHGFTKKSNKIPLKEIEIALRRNIPY